MNIALAILSYNELQGLRHFLPILPKICQECGIENYFVVDGGSTDGSLDLYRKFQTKHFVQEKKGRGEAFKLAFQNCGDDAIIFFSPDGNENPDDISKFCTLLQQGPDIVIASRMMKGAANEEDGQLFRWRKWVNQAFTLIANVLWNRGGRYVTDSINGFRAIRKDAWKMLNITSSDHTIEYQSTIRAFKLNQKIIEFPTLESGRLGGESHAKSFPTGIRFLKLLWNEIMIGKRFCSKQETAVF